jgi:hypothetical protein
MATSELELRIAASAVAVLADVRARLARVADALADGDDDLAFQIVEDLERELDTRRFL